MIKLSDYLDYLYSEIIQARKKADEKSVQVAKEYANHEYLKFFKAPRFTFPSIKMDILLKVSNISAQSKYDFKLDNEKFLNELNERIVTVNREKQLNISPVTKEEIQSTEFTELFKTLEKKDQKLVKNINDEIKKIDISPQITLLNKRVFTPQDSKVEAERAEMKRILTETIANSYSLVSTKLNDIYIDPNTTGAEDKDKLFINLHIEMEEEGLRIKSITDKNGQPVEEIIFE
jgi:erythromycin esterase-like protein